MIHGGQNSGDMSLSLPPESFPEQKAITRKFLRGLKLEGFISHTERYVEDQKISVLDEKVLGAHSSH